MAETEEATIARQRLGKHVFLATDMHATIQDIFYAVRAEIM
jgi:hypothetical protein